MWPPMMRARTGFFHRVLGLSGWLVLHGLWQNGGVNLVEIDLLRDGNMSCRCRWRILPNARARRT